MSAGGGLMGDLYRDLRDRRLLPVIGVLVVAIVAVPFLLKSEPEVVPPPAPLGAEETSEAVPAVMVEDEGIRNYRQRLDLLQSKNPFEDHFAPAPSVVEEQGAVELAPEVPIDSGVPPTTSGGSTSTSVSPIPSYPESVNEYGDGSTDTGTSTDSSDTTDSGGTSPDEIVREEYRLSYRVNVLVGASGQATERSGVKTLSFLPSRQRPVAVFVGVSEDGEQAVFMLSSDVTGTSGAGECSPSAADCQFVTLKEGERRTLTYAPEGKTPEDFTLELTGVELVVVEHGDDAVPGDGERDQQSASVPSGMAAWLGLGA